MLEPISKIKADFGLEANGRIQRFFTDCCKRHMDKYVPFDTGSTAGSAFRDTSPDSITYDTPYAIYIYEGIDMNFNKAMHPLATHHWDEFMVSAEMVDIIRECQKELNK